MVRFIRTVSCAAIATLIVGFSPVRAADTWVEAKSPHFTVVSDAGDKQARQVAFQFEQVRAAIKAGWPWAKLDLDRPVVVFAAKDENSMRRLVPQYWEQRGTIRPASVFVSTYDAYDVALRSDLHIDELGQNPWFSAFRAYASLVINASFGRDLPLWFSNGLAEVLGNTYVSGEDVQFGRPVSHLTAILRSYPRLRLPALLNVNRESSYFRQNATRDQFDAQSWALVQFLLYGAKGPFANRAERLVQLLLQSTPSEEAFRATYGNLEALEDAYRLYVEQAVYLYARLKTQVEVPSSKYAVRALNPAESAATLAGLNAAMQRPVDARALLAEARKTNANLATADAVDGMLLERERQTEQAREAYAKAVAGGTDNFWAHYRLATLSQPPVVDAEAHARLVTLLERATQLNPYYAPAHALLGDVLGRMNQFDRGAVSSLQAAQLDPTNVSYRLLLARNLARAGRVADALKVARDASTLASTDAERASAQNVIGMIERMPQ